jgi:hypothetical protein
MSEDSQYDDLVAYIDAGHRYEAAREAGELGEGIVGTYINELADGHLVDQHDPGDAPQGIDQAFLNADGEFHVGETKTIGFGPWHQPQTSRTVNGRQMDREWVADRLDGIGINATPDDVGEEPGQVHRDLFQVDIPGDAFARYSVAPDGTRANNSPDEIWTLSDIATMMDADTTEDAVESADPSETG